MFRTKKCVLWSWKYGNIKIRVTKYIILKFKVTGDLLAVWSEHKNLISSLIFAPVGQINDTNTCNYHSHLPKCSITNLNSWYILQHLCQHTDWLVHDMQYLSWQVSKFWGNVLPPPLPLWRQHIRLIQWYPSIKPHGITLQNQVVFMVTAMRTTNFTVYLNFFNKWSNVSNGLTLEIPLSSA